jgi:hypothetical protein
MIDLNPTTKTWKSATLDPPSRLYLLIRASIGRVLRMSGRGERCEDIWQDFRDPGTRGLAEDGSTPHRLQLAVIMAAYRQATVSGNTILVDRSEMLNAETDGGSVEGDRGEDEDGGPLYEDGGEGSIVESSNPPPPSPAWD